MVDVEQLIEDLTDESASVGDSKASNSDLDKPYRDERVLRELYHERGMSQAEIGEMLDVSDKTISIWMSKNSIDSRSTGETQAPDKKSVEGALDTYDDRNAVARRFFEKTARTDTEHGCIRWTAATGSSGYGQMGLDGKIYYAHRISYVLAGHNLDRSETIDHLVCGNKWCVNPDHLQPGTDADNNQSPNTGKLDEDDVEEIVRRYDTEPNTTQTDLADEFGIDQPHISEILNEKAWTAVVRRVRDEMDSTKQVPMSHYDDASA